MKLDAVGIEKYFQEDKRHDKGTISMNLSDTDINDMSIVRACILVTVGALFLQTWLMLNAFHLFWWENWFVRGNDPEWTVMMVGLGFVALSAYMTFLFRLYKIYKTEVREGIFGWAVFFGVLSFVVPALHYIKTRPEFFEFAMPIFVGFGVVVIHRILLRIAFSEALSKKVKRWIGFSAIFIFLSLVVLLLLAAVISQNRVVCWHEHWYYVLSLDIFLLTPILGPAWQNDIVLTNILLVADLIIFSTVLIFGFWNLPKKIVEKTELQKLADEY